MVLCLMDAVDQTHFASPLTECDRWVTTRRMKGAGRRDEPAPFGGKSVPKRSRTRAIGAGVHELDDAQPASAIHVIARPSTVVNTISARTGPCRTIELSFSHSRLSKRHKAGFMPIRRVLDFQWLTLSLPVRSATTAINDMSFSAVAAIIGSMSLPSEIEGILNAFPEPC